MEWFGRNLYQRGRLPTQEHAPAPAQHPDHASQQQNAGGEVSRLQAEVNRLRAQLLESQEQVEELTAQQDEDATEEEEEEPSKPSHFAAKENPLVRPSGLIDGRSNAQAAFEQKCDLLREFKAEYGHVAIPTKPPEKYKKLVGFIQKQRAFYRHVQKNPTSQKITPERIAVLEEIGVTWTKNASEKWSDNYEKLKAFREKYGHCCVVAVESFNDPDLQSFSSTQRKYLKGCKILKEKGSANNAGSQVDTAQEEKEEAASQGEEENQQDGSSEERPKKRRKKCHSEYLPEYWTDEMRDKLLALNCPWLDSFDETPQAKGCGKSGLFNSVRWYQMMEQFRAFVAQHGNGFVPIKNQRTGLPGWVRDQRRLYDLVEDGKVETCDVYQANFDFLKAIGFVFDRDVLQKEEERVRILEAEEVARQRAKESSAGKLEAAKKVEEDATKALDNANKKLADARREVKAAKTALTAAKAAVKKAEIAVKIDPVGKTVQVKPRGDCKPGGLAKVLAVRTTMVLGSELSFYDVKYIDSGEKDLHVDGIFVSKVDEGFCLLTAAAEEVSNLDEGNSAIGSNQPCTRAATRSTTRKARSTTPSAANPESRVV